MTKYTNRLNNNNLQIQNNCKIIVYLIYHK